MGQPGVQYVRGAVWAWAACPPKQTETNRIARADLNEDMGISQDHQSGEIISLRHQERQRRGPPWVRSFRGDAQHRTRNLEIPGSVLPDRPGMTVSLLRAIPHAVSSTVLKSAGKMISSTSASSE